MRRWLLALLTLICAAAPVQAAGWPDNFLGPPDTTYVNLNLGVFYFGAVLDDISDEHGVSPLPLQGQGPDGSALPADKDGWLARLAALPELDQAGQQAEFRRVQGELNQTRSFYWRNSRFNCALSLTYLESVLDKPLLRSALVQSEPPYDGPAGMPRYDAVRGNYDGFLHIMVLYRYNPASGQLERESGGGGFTVGGELKPGTPGVKTGGWSWWAAPTAGHECGSDWLFCHEFGHQLDSLFEQSGHPEFWFNHLAHAEANIARFGEHFDCMAFILRRVPEGDWHDLRWGEQRSATDADQDGVPDADNWLTGHGFLTDPDCTTADSDGDGLNDFQEFMAMNGNRRGHGDRLHDALHSADPFRSDSDGDGIPDGADPLPWLPMTAFIPRASAGADPLAFLTPAATVPAPGMSAPCHLALPAAGQSLPLALDLAYSPDESLQLSLAWCDADPAAPDGDIRLMLDLDNNGWFDGDDNYRLRLDARGIQSLTQNWASSERDWPSEKLVKLENRPVSCTALTPPPGYRHACRLVFSHGQFPAFQGKSGECLGLNVGVRQTGQAWFYTCGEPNALIPFTLR